MLISVKMAQPIIIIIIFFEAKDDYTWYLEKFFLVLTGEAKNETLVQVETTLRLS